MDKYRLEDTMIELPKVYEAILADSQKMGFDQQSDPAVGLLLKSLCASKPKGSILELGTGSGLSTYWMASGMCPNSTLITIDSDADLVSIAKKNLGSDLRIAFEIGDGVNLIQKLKSNTFDLIFADTWPGKYHHLDETLNLLKIGGFYVIDDMLPQPNWPDNHHEKAQQLLINLKSRHNFIVAPIAWASGVAICVKISD